jgi:hypothetical protein
VIAGDSIRPTPSRDVFRPTFVSGQVPQVGKRQSADRCLDTWREGKADQE